MTAFHRLLTLRSQAHVLIEDDVLPGVGKQHVQAVRDQCPGELDQNEQIGIQALEMELNNLDAPISSHNTPDDSKSLKMFLVNSLLSVRHFFPPELLPKLCNLVHKFISLIFCKQSASQVSCHLVRARLVPVLHSSYSAPH